MYEMRNYVKDAVRTESPFLPIPETLKLRDTLDMKQVLWLRPDVKLFRVMHAAMGLCTEAGELAETLVTVGFQRTITPTQIVNLKEEGGDLFWYAAILCDALEWDFLTLLEDASTERLTRPVLFPSFIGSPEEFRLAAIQAYGRVVTDGAGKVMDVVKRRMFYSNFAKNKIVELDETKLRAGAVRTLSGIAGVFSVFAIQSVEVCELNIAKLKARFPEKFTDTDALTRDIATEQNILSGGVTAGRFESKELNSSSAPSKITVKVPEAK